MMKSIYLLFLLAVSVSCGGGLDEGLSNLPIVNSVAEINYGTASAVPFTSNEVFLLSGKVSGNLYVLGKGIIEVSDFEKPDEKIYIMCETTHVVGETITFKVSKRPLIKINDEGIDMYVKV